MRWQELRTTGDGAQLHVRRLVEPAAPPILLLHGLGVGGAVWQSFARRLLPERAAVAPDLRGHGQSDAPRGGYEPRGYALDLAALIEDLRLQPLPVVGHSLGALVALALADLRPELVEWLALLDPPLDSAQRNPEVPEVYRLRHAPAGELEGYLRSRSPGSELLAPLFRHAADRAFEAMLEHDHTRQALQQAAHLDMPCLVVQADPDKGGVLGDAAAQRLTRSLANGELVKIQRASHAVHATHPAQLAETLKTWDRRARRPPGPGSTAGDAC
ncbi:MAG TPA: alpha/beta hydrolase [Chloroflexota bacterium]|nr:alpha/beta hydrolase [Chloroflexota bacterium]